MRIKPFIYIPKLDCFIVNDAFQTLCDRLRLTEWSAVVWMGRLFARDQDFGEHWFDNWDEREDLAVKAKELGIDIDEESMLVVVPDNFTEGHQFCVHCFDKNDAKPLKEVKCPNCGEDVNISPDGPCYSDRMKKSFWTDVLDSITISIDTLFILARESYDPAFEEIKSFDLEKEISEIKREIEENSVIGY